MDSKEQIIVTLKKENEYLKKENEFLKSEFIRLTGNIPSVENYANQGFQNGHFSHLPIIPNLQNFSHNTQANHSHEDYEKLKEENSELKKIKDKFERQSANLINENAILNAKLNNLENVFVGSQIIRNSDGSISNESGQDYNTSTVRKINILLHIYCMAFKVF
jgi:hypothetical protein